MRVTTFRTRNLWLSTRGKSNLDSGKFWLRHSLQLNQFLAMYISSRRHLACSSAYVNTRGKIRLLSGRVGGGVRRQSESGRVGSGVPAPLEAVVPATQPPTRALILEF